MFNHGDRVKVIYDMFGDENGSNVGEYGTVVDCEGVWVRLDSLSFAMRFDESELEDASPSQTEALPDSYRPCLACGR